MCINTLGSSMKGLDNMPMTADGQNVAPWIQTIAGRAFDFECMANNYWDAEEVATVLSRTLRFAGHTKWPYSVAQHSVLVSRQYDYTKRPRFPLVALLHDAPETYIGDIVAPLKFFLGGDASDLSSLEWSIWCWVADQHGLHEHAERDAVKLEDLRALATEARDLMAPPPKPWIKLPPPWKDRIEPWSTDYARDEWLRSYGEVTELEVRLS